MLLENGTERCNCVRKTCERHGNCKACLLHHQKQNGIPPYCKRQKCTRKTEIQRTPHP